MFYFVHFFTGYYKIEIRGLAKERFLNLCSNKNILLWDLKRNEEQYVFFVSVKAYEELKKIKEKTNVTWTIKGEYGLPFFLYRYQKRKFFAFGSVLFFVTIYILSLFVWDIQINGTQQYTEEEIKKYLIEKNIKEGTLKKKVSCSELEEDIREDFEETAWVSCDLKGTCLTINVKESINLKDISYKGNNEPNDIVAFHSGTIVSIITRNGTPLVKKGDSVKKGDVLISGLINLYNDYDEILETTKTSADGDIYAETIYDYKEEFPLVYYEKVYGEEKWQQYSVILGNYKISLPVKRKIESENIDVISEKYPFKIGNDFYLPMAFQKSTYMGYKTNKVALNQVEGTKKAEKKIEEYLSGFSEEEKEVTSKDFTITFTDNVCHIEGVIHVIEPIGKIRNIS